MFKDYKISNDGTIFEIQEDGSISKIARIDSNGKVTNVNESANISRTKKGPFGFFIILFLISTVVLGFMYVETSNSLDFFISEYYEAKDKLSEVSEAYPIIITDIEFANVYKGGEIETDYGNRIYDYNSMFITPKVKYLGISNGTKTFDVKWYNQDGTMRRGNSSPEGFSFSDDIYISNGEHSFQLSGWGNENKGHWDYGTYRIEIWYKNTCLKSETIKVY